MELLLDGKEVSNNITKSFEKRLEKLKQEKKIVPYLAVIGIEGNDASGAYIRRIQKNCEKYGIKFLLKLAKNENEFITFFNEIKANPEITGIMCQQPLPRSLFDLVNTIPLEKDIEGITHLSLGVVVGRSNIVGKPLIPQLLNKNATVTICHSKTQNIENILRNADVIIMAIGKAKFLKKEMIKENSILIDVGINFEDGKMCGDIDFEDVKEKAYAITPVPGGIGVVTNSLLIDNIIRSTEYFGLI